MKRLFLILAIAVLIATFNTVALTNPRIAPGAGTGITVNDAGSARQLTYKVTVTKDAFVCDDQ